MILLTLNLKGVGGDLKLASLHRLLTRNLPDNLFFQETLVEEKKARTLVNTLCPNWMVCAVNSVGRSRGLVVAWDPLKLNLVPLSCGGILPTGTILEGNQQVTLLNCYGPCFKRKFFWDKLVSSVLLAYKNLIVARDLNFTINVGEVWGETTRLDQLAGYLKGILQDNHLVDILPSDIGSSWRNGRVRCDEISRTLD